MIIIIIIIIKLFSFIIITKVPRKLVINVPKESTPADFQAVKTVVKDFVEKTLSVICSITSHHMCFQDLRLSLYQLTFVEVASREKFTTIYVTVANTEKEVTPWLILNHSVCILIGVFVQIIAAIVNVERELEIASTQCRIKLQWFEIASRPMARTYIF